MISNAMGENTCTTRAYHAPPPDPLLNQCPCAEQTKRAAKTMIRRRKGWPHPLAMPLQLPCFAVHGPADTSLGCWFLKRLSEHPSFSTSSAGYYTGRAPSTSIFDQLLLGVYAFHPGIHLPCIPLPHPLHGVHVPASPLPQWHACEPCTSFLCIFSLLDAWPIEVPGASAAGPAPARLQLTAAAPGLRGAPAAALAAARALPLQQLQHRLRLHRLLQQRPACL